MSDLVGSDLKFSSFDFLPQLQRQISTHPSVERPMLNRLCRSLIDLIFVLDQLDCCLVDSILYPAEPYELRKTD